MGKAREFERGENKVDESEEGPDGAKDNVSDFVGGMSAPKAGPPVCDWIERLVSRLHERQSVCTNHRR